MTDVRNTPPTPSPDDLHVLAGEYVLGTLPAADRQTVQQRLPRRLLPPRSPGAPCLAVWQRVWVWPGWLTR